MLTADHLAFLLDKVLADPTYRENARNLQKAIAEANGLSVAADLIEEPVGMSRKVGRGRLATVDVANFNGRVRANQRKLRCELKSSS
jgi:hypothetical protein